MRTLERDGRGFPVPFIALRDKSGRPQFTVNDVRKTEEARKKRLCSICGKRLGDSVWFIGGSRCFTLDEGAFVDGPTHEECANFAIRVCPFLAAPSYGRRIDDKLLKPGDEPDGMLLAKIPHMLPDRPERFGLGETHEYESFLTDRQGWVYRAFTWDYVSWWQAGTEVNAPDGPPPMQAWSQGRILR
jgi:hypothetical protein